MENKKQIFKADTLCDFTGRAQRVVDAAAAGV